MNVVSFYDAIGGGYEDVLTRLPNDVLIVKFVKKFLNEDSFVLLEKAIKEGNIKGSFEQCHKLKGVAGNLGFIKLYKISAELCDQLRSLTVPADLELFRLVKIEYELVIKNINQLD